MERVLLVIFSGKCQNTNSSMLRQRGILCVQGVGPAQTLQDPGAPTTQLEMYPLLCLGSVLFSGKFFPLVAKMATKNSRLSLYQVTTPGRKTSSH
jgi:hypothetical protein